MKHFTWEIAKKKLIVSPFQEEIYQQLGTVTEIIESVENHTIRDGMLLKHCGSI